MKIQIQSTTATSKVAVNIAVPANYTGQYAFAVSGDPRSVQAVDLNGDGFQDIFIQPSFYNIGQALSPIVLINDGTGRFTDGTAKVFNLDTKIELANGVFFRDFNSDGRIDLFVVDQGLEIGDAYIGGFKGAKNQLFLQDTNGILQDATANIQGNVAAFNHVSSVVDINNDGNLDILVTRLGGPALEGSGTFFYMSDGKGNFSFSTAGLPTEIKYLTNTARDWSSKTVDYQYSGSVGAGDLNNDGRQDIISGSYITGDQLTGKHTVRVFEHTATGDFVQRSITQQPDTLIRTVGVMGVAGIETGDMNGDGRAEVVLHWEIGPTSAVQILRNEGNFQFTDVTTDWLGSYLVRDANGHEGSDFQQLYSLANLRDINRDGVFDLSLVNFNTDPSQLADGTSGGAYAYINDGAGKLSAMNMFIGDNELSATELMNMTTNSEWAVGLPVLIDANNDGITDTTFIDYSTDITRDVAPYRTTALNISTVFGSDSNHVYRANDVGETLRGTNTSDTFHSGRGNDVFNGGAGVDILVIAGNKADFSILRTSEAIRVGGAYGTDMLQNIERIQFADAAIALDINGTAGQAFRLYQAAFDRAPDIGGLGYWINHLDVGATLTSVAGAFTGSPEFRAMYGNNVSTQTFVTKLYNNVLDRNPDAGGFDWWSDQIDSGKMTRPEVLVGFSESTENQVNLIGVMQNGFEYVPFVG